VAGPLPPLFHENLLSFFLSQSLPLFQAYEHDSLDSPSYQARPPKGWRPGFNDCFFSLIKCLKASPQRPFPFFFFPPVFSFVIAVNRLEIEEISGPVFFIRPHCHFLVAVFFFFSPYHSFWGSDLVTFPRVSSLGVTCGTSISPSS